MKLCHQYIKQITSNKYMKHSNKNKQSSYLKYWIVTELYGWEMLQMLHVNSFKWVEEISQSNLDVLKSYNEESDEEYFLEFDVQYPKKVCDLFNDLPFYMQKYGKIEKLVVNLINKIEHVIHTRSLKQALNHGLVSKKMHRIIKLNQVDGLKSYIDMNKELGKHQIMIFKNIF